MGSASESRPGVPTKPSRRSGETAGSSIPPPQESSRNSHGIRNNNAGGEFEGINAGLMAAASSSSMRPISMEASEEDAVLQGAEFLSRIEVTRRRLRRDEKLIKLYKRMYWGLMEEARVRYRNYYWTYGRSPMQEESESEGDGDDGGVPAGAAEGEELHESGKAGEIGGSRKRDRDRCAFPGCKTKPMALTLYCHPHILSDSKQLLYKPCSFSVKSSSQTGPVICGKPILSAGQPSYCPTHIQKAQKNVSQALKKAGLVLNPNKPPPKINVIIVEYVRQIQAKRRAARRALEALKTIDEEAADGEDLSGED